MRLATMERSYSFGASDRWINTNNDDDDDENDDNTTVCGPGGGGSRTLAERNEAEPAVEDAHDLQDDPFVLALLTGMQRMEQRMQEEEKEMEQRMQEEEEKEKEMEQRTQQEEKEKLVQFQDNIRGRVQKAHALKKKLQRQKTSQQVDCEQRLSPQRPQSSHRQQHDSPAKHLLSPSPYLSPLGVCGPLADNKWEAPDLEDNGEQRTAEQHHQRQQQPGKDVEHVRHRLAKCQILTDGEMTSELPTRDKTISKTSGAGDTPKEVSDVPSTGPQDRPPSPVQQNVHPGQPRVPPRGVPVPREHPGAGSKTGNTTVPTSPRALWRLADLQELKEQYLSRFATLRRLYMDIERDQVKERQQRSEHLKRVASVKRERERARQKEERSLRRQRAAGFRMEERELLVLERLQLEEEQRSAEVEKRRKPEVKDRRTFAEALRARLRERLPREKVVDLPPLCSCGDAFWDANPDTCANTCVFYQNPSAYVKALQSAVCGI